MLLSFLYRTRPGSVVLHVLTRPWLTEAAGKLMDSRFSRALIGPFIAAYRIDTRECAANSWPSFNAFFTRKLRKGARWVDHDPMHLAAPCDGRLTIYPLDVLSSFTVKGIRYTLSTLLRDRSLAARYKGGTCFVFRLTPADYHRCHYPDDGRQSSVRHISGIYHTVQPEALTCRPVFRENARDYALLRTDNFGDILYMEVGAMLVGRICQVHGKGRFARGEEKSHFSYGGSTVILVVKKDQVRLRSDLLRAMAEEKEVFVRMGEPVAIKADLRA